MTKNQSDKGLTGAQLKWMAIVLMAIDHIGAAIVEPMLLGTVPHYFTDRQLLYWIYMVMRCLGRFSFPMFCFLMVEGFVHTRSKVKYLRNLLIFAVISEVPFDLALTGEVWSVSHQNVFLTLAMGLAAIWFTEYIVEKQATKQEGFAEKQSSGALTTGQNSIFYHVDIGQRLIMVIVVLAIALAAEALSTDYGAVGVCVIFVLYLMREKKVAGAIWAWIILSLSNWLEVFCFPFIGAVKLYNGKRGRQNKYFFYIFYPAHLLLLYIARIVLFQ